MKRRALSFITVLCVLQVFSVQAETVGEALEKCRSTDNSLKRLVCYDRVAKSLDQYQGVGEEVGTIQPMPRPRQPGAVNAPTASSPRDVASEFGLENKKKETYALDELALTITDISDNLRGKKVVTFSDGSVWQQTDNNYLKIEVGQTVTIERGFLGAFFLGVDGLNKRMKVKRLK